MSELGAYNKTDRRYLLKFVCAWCDHCLGRPGCSALFDGACVLEDREQRRQDCLAARRKRGVHIKQVDNG